MSTLHERMTKGDAAALAEHYGGRCSVTEHQRTDEAS